MKMISRVALALALLAATVGTTTLQADTFDRVAPPTVRVINNHGRDVMVYVVDSDHHRHLLGRVGRSELKDLQIPSGVVFWGTRTVQLKVYPVLPRRLRITYTSSGIKTRWFSIQSDQVIELNLERTLARSQARIVSG